MNALTTRAAMIAAQATGEKGKPNIFAGIAPLCDDIVAALERASEQSANLRAARAVADLPRLNEANVALGIQLVTLTRQQESLAQVLRWHDERLKDDGGRA